MSVKKQNNIINNGLKAVNTTLANMYSSRAQTASRKAVRMASVAKAGSTATKNAAHGATMDWGMMKDPIGMRRSQATQAAGRARFTRQAADASVRAARDSRAFATRAKKAAGRAR